MPSLRYGSVCSGVESATLAWRPLGWKAAWLSEVEPAACSVLKECYPNTPNLGDMTKYKEWPSDGKYAIDLLVGGTPCQSFSVAGLRKGLADPRGNLVLVYLGILDKYRPRWCVWENVPGVLSSTSLEAESPNPPEERVCAIEGEEEMEVRDILSGEELHAFGCFLSGLRELGYSFSYRVLDAQYFGVPQRRRRVFVVGHLGDWRPAAAVLFDAESVSGNPPPRREKRKEASPSTGSGIESASWNGGGGIAKALTAKGGVGRFNADETFVLSQETAPSLRAQSQCSHRADSEAFVCDARGYGDGRTSNSICGDHTDRTTDYTPLVIGLDTEHNAHEELMGTLKGTHKDGSGQHVAAPTHFERCPDTSTANALLLADAPTLLLACRERDERIKELEGILTSIASREWVKIKAEEAAQAMRNMAKAAIKGGK